MPACSTLLIEHNNPRSSELVVRPNCMALQIGGLGTFLVVPLIHAGILRGSLPLQVTPKNLELLVINGSGYFL